MNLIFRKAKATLVQLIINFLLFLTAIVLYILLTPINLLIVTIGGGTISAYLLSTATTIDKVAAWEFRTLWRMILIKSNGIGFDDIRFTLSYFLGLNKERGSLTQFGLLICKILHFFDKNHVEKAVDQVRRDYKV